MEPPDGIGNPVSIPVPITHNPAKNPPWEVQHLVQVQAFNLADIVWTLDGPPEYALELEWNHDNTLPVPGPFVRVSDVAWRLSDDNTLPMQPRRSYFYTINVIHKNGERFRIKPEATNDAGERFTIDPEVENDPTTI